MLISLHKNARTTPVIRAEMAASSESAAVLAKRFNVTEQTAAKWLKRTNFEDRSHTAHRLQIQLTPAQEMVVVHLRRTLLLPLDDLLAVTKEFICPSVSRRVSSYLSPHSCGQPLNIVATRMRFDDAVSFRVECDRANGRPVTCVA